MITAEEKTLNYCRRAGGSTRPLQAISLPAKIRDSPTFLPGKQRPKHIHQHLCQVPLLCGIELRFLSGRQDNLSVITKATGRIRTCNLRINEVSLAFTTGKTNQV